MERLLLLDKADYEGIEHSIDRIAVRGVIFIGGKLLLIEENSGELKLPGGGQEEGEDDITTLCREVREETGFDVDISTVREFGYVEELRRSFYEEAVWHQVNRLYFCDVFAKQHECSYSEGEIKRGTRQVLRTVDEAIHQNSQLTDGRWKPCEMREYNSFLLIKQYLKGNCK